MVKKSLPGSGLGRDFGQPDGGLHCFYLAEKGAKTAEVVVPPVVEQARCLRGDLPLIGIGQEPPGVHVTTHLIDDRCGIVLLPLC